MKYIQYRPMEARRNRWCLGIPLLAENRTGPLKETGYYSRRSPQMLLLCFGC
jgi:hypothetical protein